MDNKSLIDSIADKNVNISAYVEKVIHNEKIRVQVIDNLLNNKDIMVYYHCYYIVSRASEEKPSLFYKYWDDFVKLLDHNNSYHRDIGLTLIANLTQVDNNDYFSNVYEKYIEHINDLKFMTAECFVKNLKKIVVHKSEYVDQIIKLILNIEVNCSYPTRQKELLKSSVIEVLELVYESTSSKDEIEKFVKLSLNSSSPKTRKVASGFIKKFSLNEN